MNYELISILIALSGILGGLVYLIFKIGSYYNHIENRFKNIESVTEDIKKINFNLDNVNRITSGLEVDNKYINIKLDNLSDKLENLDNRFNKIEDKLEDISKKTVNLEIEIKNTNTNLIKIENRIERTEDRYILFLSGKLFNQEKLEDKNLKEVK